MNWRKLWVCLKFQINLFDFRLVCRLKQHFWISYWYLYSWLALLFFFWDFPCPYISYVLGNINWLLSDFSLCTIGQFFLIRIFQFKFLNDIPHLIWQFISPMTILSFSFDFHYFTSSWNFCSPIWINRYLLNWQDSCISYFHASFFFHTQFLLFIFNICLVFFQFSITYIVIFP